jgi:flavin reductase (DIM6/NTAB) family NADH-FMN oxidoreductase RutF
VFYNKFVTIIGLITSSGSSGLNIMAYEWTHYLSYKPGLIAVSLGSHKDNSWKYSQNQEFGINIVHWIKQYFLVYLR